MKCTVFEFIHDLSWEDIPEGVRLQARRCLLDTLGAAIAGRTTACSRIIHDHAATVFGGRDAFLWQDGREVSPPGAALANGMTIDSLDIHDGYKLVKGHAGVAIVPAIFAALGISRKKCIPGIELLTCLVVGYEIALRAGLALHNTACDYHSSGAWNALGCAAVTGRELCLSVEETRQALGIAEYHGPRSQIMRCVDHPTMVKDGSGWGAMSGVSAGMLAAAGFSGAPAATVELGQARAYWEDLGTGWKILDLYFKPYAVCYWAQPAIAGVLDLQQQHTLDLERIRELRVFTFHQATRLTSVHPQTTDEAQYSLPFPVAAALVHGHLGPNELDGNSLQDPFVLKLAEKVTLVEEQAYSQAFPARRMARLEVEMQDGTVFSSAEKIARWEPTSPPTDGELLEKFRWLASTCLIPPKYTSLEALIWGCANLANARELESALTQP